MPPKKTKSSSATSDKKSTRSSRSKNTVESDDASLEQEPVVVVAAAAAPATRRSASNKKTPTTPALATKASDKSTSKTSARATSVESVKRKVILSESESEQTEVKEKSGKNTRGSNRGSKIIQVKEIEVKEEEGASSAEEEVAVSKKLRQGKNKTPEVNKKNKQTGKVKEAKKAAVSTSNRPVRSTRQLKKPVSYQESYGSDFEDDEDDDGNQDDDDDSDVELDDEEDESSEQSEEEEDEDEDFSDGKKKKKGSSSAKKQQAKKGKKKLNLSVENSQESDLGDMVDEDNEGNSKGGNKKKTSAATKKTVREMTTGTDQADSTMVIDVRREQNKIDVEDRYEMPYYLTKAYIRDIENRPITDPNYDGSTVFIPVQEINKETPLFKQYWKSKAMNYDKVVFFRFGRNFMCFFNDALLLKSLFDCYVSMWGKRPITNVFDNSLRFYMKELLEKHGKSCVIVDQVQFNEEKNDDNDLIKREVTQIITSGTYTDYLDNNDDYNSRYLMTVVESGSDHSFGLTLVDCTTHQIYVDDIKNDPAGNQFRTILQKMKPVEIHSVLNNMSEQSKNICKTTCKPQFTFNKTYQFTDLPSVFEEIKNEFREKIPIGGKAAAALAAPAPVLDEEEEEATEKMEIEKQPKDNNKKGKSKKMVAEDEEEEQQSSSSEDNSDLEEEEDENTGDNDEDQEGRPTFTYGELSADYPSLLREIEEMYVKEKKQFEETNKEVDMAGGDEPNFDVKFQYYMMLQSLLVSLTYLRSLKLSDNVFRMGTFNLLDSNVQKSTSLHLDAHAIENLDIFEVNLQSQVTSEGSLMSFIDRTKTPFGRRMLKKWLAYPLKSIEQIEQRQEAIEDLMAIEPVINEFDKKLSKLGDLERQISRMFNSSQKSRLKPSSFENFSSSRLKDAFQLAKDLKTLEDLLPIFSDYKDNFKSDRLKKLSTVKDQEASKRLSENLRQQASKTSYLGAKILGRRSGGKKGSEQEIIGMFPDLKPFVDLIESQLEQDDQGFCQPKAGADPIYDEVVAKIKRIYKKMNVETSFWRKKLNNFDIKLIKSKMAWEIQIPEKLVEGQKKPKELHLTSKIKGYQRFHTDVIIRLCVKLKKAEQLLQKALSPFCERFFFQFYKNRDLLFQAINCIGELDCLCSLAKCAYGLDVRCKPVFVPQDEQHVFELREMYHPQMLTEKRKVIVPNDTVFDKNVIAMLVTGPNMGGKSTLLRQTCLAVILAQIGAFVPARSFKTSIKDRIFCRIGASDRLLEGKSTFLVEMEETGDIVKEATKSSIVLLDELGRGTSTFDGVSIAYGVLRYIVEEIQCLTLFSTHYHMLVDEFKLYNSVENYCMDFEFIEEDKHKIKAPKKGSSNNDGEVVQQVRERRIHFKYKFIKGFSEKSFGINVAKLASLADSIIDRASEKEDEINSENQNLGNLLKVTKKFNEVIKPFILSDDILHDDWMQQQLSNFKI